MTIIVKVYASAKDRDKDGNLIESVEVIDPDGLADVVQKHSSPARYFAFLQVGKSRVMGYYEAAKLITLTAVTPLA